MGECCKLNVIRALRAIYSYSCSLSRSVQNIPSILLRRVRLETNDMSLVGSGYTQLAIMWITSLGFQSPATHTHIHTHTTLETAAAFVATHVLHACVIGLFQSRENYGITTDLKQL